MTEPRMIQPYWSSPTGIAGKILRNWELGNYYEESCRLVPSLAGLVATALRFLYGRK
jgi:hypothetical protein